MKHVTLYTDGACSGNPGPGGWGCFLSYRDKTKKIYGGDCKTTNNQMELTAVIQGLSLLKEPCVVDLYTDSKYVKEGAEQWLPGWKKNNWRKSNKKPVLNVELWQKLDTLLSQHKINWHWVRGHNGDEFNELVDALACQGRDEASALTVPTDPNNACT